MAHTLPTLSYSYDTLEPYIDAKTMEIHHSKHHQAYITNLNNAIAGKADLEAKSIEALISDLNAVPEDIRGAVRNNGGGHANHSFFWKTLAKNGGEPAGSLLAAINNDFGSVEAFKEKFETAAKTRFGSGWSWLALSSNGTLEVFSLPNQDSPLMEGKKPILGLDVWEHAYYLNYQNRRPDYVAAFWNIVNWSAVEEIFQAAK